MKTKQPIKEKKKKSTTGGLVQGREQFLNDGTLKQIRFEWTVKEVKARNSQQIERKNEFMAKK